MKIENIPEKVKKEYKWCLWKRTQGKKLLFNPKTHKVGDPSDETTFADFDFTIKEFNRGNYDGIGIGVFNNICAIDIDHCIDDEKNVSDMAKDIIKKVNSYTEISPSGHGIRILFETDDTFVYDKEKYYINNRSLGLEVYLAKATSKFVTITGNKICGEYKNAQDKLQYVLDNYMKRKNEKVDVESKPIVIYDLSNDMLKIGLENDKLLKELWNMIPSMSTTNESELDMALCSKLNYWLSNDEEKVYQAFLSSPYAQQKDEKHKAKLQRDDYLRMTIRNARVLTTANDKNIEFQNSQMVKKLVETVEHQNKYLERLKTLSQIKRKDKSEYVYVKSNYLGIDNLIGGFILGQISVWSGLNGSGKSAFLNQQIIEYKIQGYKTMLFSGELPDYSIKNILYRLIAGKKNLKQNVQKTYWYLDNDELKNKIDNWFGNDLLVYKNEFGMKAKEIIETIKAAKNNYNVDMVILDNLMTLDLSDYNKFDKYEAQSMFAKELANLSKELNIHIHVVMHPRKVAGFLRKTDISGSADLSNAVDNVFIIHRVNEDFKKAYMDFFKTKNDEPIFMRNSVIEICKNREEGIQDEMVGLYFQKETKQFTTYQANEIDYLKEVK